MLDKIEKELQHYPSAVITWVDESGYPYSVRCAPHVPSDSDSLILDLPAGAGPREGNASLLCHRHNEKTWNLRSFLARGVLKQDGGRWTFTPRSLSCDSGGVLDAIRFIWRSRRSAAAYLRRRDLSRPSIDWAHLEEFKD